MGILIGVYSRNQFEPLPEPLLSINDINSDSEIPLRTAASKQSQGGGQDVKRITVNARKTTNFVIQGAIKPASVA